MGDGWIRPAQVKLVHDAVLAACDAQDGVADGLVEDPVGCKKHFDPAKLLCASGASGDQCLSEAQVTAIRTLHGPYKFSFALANGVSEYPGWSVSGEGTKSFGPTGGWSAWWLGSAPPALPQVPANGIAWVYGSGAIQHIFARDPNFDVRKYRPEDFADRVREVSALMDSTNPDLGAFKARGGKLIVLEHMADYAQSPYAGIGYFREVQKRMGEAGTRGIHAPLYGARRRSRRQRRAGECGYAVGSRRLGGAGSRARRSHRRRAAAGAADRGRPRAAAVPMAGLAALQSGRCEERRQFCMCAMM